MKKERSDFLKIVSGGILAALIGGMFLASWSWASCGKCAPPPGGSTSSVPTAPGSTPGHTVPTRPPEGTKPDTAVLFDGRPSHPVGTLKDKSGDIDPDILDKLEKMYGGAAVYTPSKEELEARIRLMQDNIQNFPDHSNRSNWEQQLSDAQSQLSSLDRTSTTFFDVHLGKGKEISNYTQAYNLGGDISGYTVFYYGDKLRAAQASPNDELTERVLQPKIQKGVSARKRKR